jgi:hypothetical protein
MGGAKGGSSGRVDWPEYLKDIHSTFLSSEGTDSLVFSCVGLLNEATSSNPFSGMVAYTGDEVVGAIQTSAAAAIGSVLALEIDPYARFQANLALCAQENVLDLSRETTHLNNLMTDRRPALGVALGDNSIQSIINGTSFSSAGILSRPIVVNDWIGKAFEDTKGVSKNTLQRGMSVVTDTLFLTENDMKLMHFSAGVYELSVEMVKLNILNKREGTTQLADHLLTEGKWAVTQYQVMANGIASLHGGIPMTSHPQILSAAQAANDAFNPFGARGLRGHAIQSAKSGMTAASGAMTGMLIGSYFGPVGMAVGAVIGGIVGTVASFF